MKSEKRKALEKSERIPDGRKSVPPLVVFSRACATLFLSARSRSAAGRFIAVGKRERRSPWRPSYLDVERVALSELLLVTRVLEPHAPPTRPDQAGLRRVRTGTLHAQIGMKICLGGEIKCQYRFLHRATPLPGRVSHVVFQFPLSEKARQQSRSSKKATSTW